MIAKGDVFGADQPLQLHLFDSAEMMGVMRAVATELVDCVLPLLLGCVVTADPAVAFSQVSAVFLIGAVRRMAYHERSVDDDLFRSNAILFKEYGELLDAHALPDVRVLVMGDGANTNALICSLYAPTIARKQFTAMTRLDQNRASARIAEQLQLPVAGICNMIVWGNHLGTQLPDTSQALVSNDFNGQTVRAAIEATTTSPAHVVEYLEKEFVEQCTMRHAQVLQSRQMTPAMSYARAASDHMRDWCTSYDIVSMGVMSDGSYDLPPDIVCSFPVRIHNGQWSIVADMDVGDFEGGFLYRIGRELLAEKDAAIDAVTRHDEMMAEWAAEKAKEKAKVRAKEEALKKEAAALEAVMREQDKIARYEQRCEYPVYC